MKQVMWELCAGPSLMIKEVSSQEEGVLPNPLTPVPSPILRGSALVPNMESDTVSTQLRSVENTNEQNE